MLIVQARGFACRNSRHRPANDTGWLPEPIRIAPERPEDTTFAQDDENEEVNHTEE